MDSETLVTDLQFACTTKQAVEVTYYGSGGVQLKGVHSVSPELGFVTFWAPKTFADRSTMKVGLDDITSIAVTDVEYDMDEPTDTDESDE